MSSSSANGDVSWLRSVGGSRLTRHVVCELWIDAMTSRMPPKDKDTIRDAERYRVY